MDNKMYMDNKEWQDYTFDFERLEVYKISLDYVHKVINLVRRLTSDLKFSLGEQLIRATISILNNLAEGTGKRSKKEKIRYYGYSLDSARECIPMISILFEQKQIPKETHESLRADCIKICNMLGKLIGSI